MVVDQPVEVGKASLGDNPECARQFEDRVVGEAVVDVEALLAALDQAGLAQSLEVLRGVGDREADLDRERLDGALALREELQNLEAVRARQRLPDAGELAVEAILEGAMGGVVAWSSVLLIH